MYAPAAELLRTVVAKYECDGRLEALKVLHCCLEAGARPWQQQHQQVVSKASPMRATAAALKEAMLINCCEVNISEVIYMLHPSLLNTSLLRAP
jgi:hypothetical protein